MKGFNNFHLTLLVGAIVAGIVAVMVRSVGSLLSPAMSANGSKAGVNCDTR